MVGFGCLGAIAALVVIGGIGAAVGGSGDTAAKPPAAGEVPAKVKKDDSEKSVKQEGQQGQPAKADAKPAEQPKKTQGAEFQEFIRTNGTSAEKQAADHVVRVQGADEQNNVLDSAEIHTDYTGGLLGPHAKDGKLLASIFAEWKQSENGLVTVYDAGGEILSNGNF
ncbi:hypothetical protein C6N75_26260 [Streptomyces solincola]|uniref:Uncharacterized protein n=1 Tax=Streptomyces solincola TaxID=2100817 RepID=A0A2S9PPJ4_9ACTN|nr:hypothetical protein C6N75_26260 [Streptomyces solincola]